MYKVTNTKYHACIFYRFKKENCILWGVWQSQIKPQMNQFLKPFITEIQQLTQNGFFMYPNNNFEDVFIRVLLVVSTVDLQARSPLLSVLHQQDISHVVNVTKTLFVLQQRKVGVSLFWIYRRI